ncbi:M23 family metallopeptidase [Daejeonella sp.]|uniref:M23 family metallopeptidase n=1 Tax=Daejeonella sp. TaxID=2805397 RepID=UPI0030C33EF8
MNTSFSIRSILYLFIISIVFISSCKSGLFNVFKPTSPHETYEKNLISSGLDKTAMGKTWIEMSDKILQTPVAIKIPYLEKGYFPPDKVQAAAFSFKMERGQKLHVKLNRKPLQSFMIYTDIWARDEGGVLKMLGSSDTLGAFQSDINQTSTYILRLQPELLAGGEYTLEITSGPSLDYPLKSYQRNQIRSFWGDGRDANSRKHEGVDIFSAFRTPVVAIAAGTIRVNENDLGGKVVWLRPEGKDFTLYYAHLDEQTVAHGQTVQIGDTLGRMGNTGNAKTTPPHLHFGIYTRDGAIDPLPFINPVTKRVPEIRSQTKLLNSTLRTTGNASLTSRQSVNALRNGTILRVLSASENNYRVELPDGATGFVAAGKVSESSGILRNIKLSSSQTNLFDRPDTSAAVKLTLRSGERVNLIGSFGDFDLISTGGNRGWIKR